MWAGFVHCVNLGPFDTLFLSKKTQENRDSTASFGKNSHRSSSHLANSATMAEFSNPASFLMSLVLLASMHLLCANIERITGAELMYTCFHYMLLGIIFTHFRVSTSMKNLVSVLSGFTRMAKPMPAQLINRQLLHLDENPVRLSSITGPPRIPTATSTWKKIIVYPRFLGSLFSDSAHYIVAMQEDGQHAC